MPSFITGKRSRLITIAAAGTLTVTAAVSATAAALPSGSAAASAGAAYSHLMLADQQQAAARAARGETVSEEQTMILITRARYLLAERQREHLAALARAASARAAARQAAAARAAAAKAAAAAQRAATARAAAQRQAARQQAAQPRAASAPSGSPQQIAERMLSQFGWSSSQFSCLQPLWDRESGWNPYAQNPSSGAYGIPQALPGSKMASAGGDWQTNPATQIRWGLSYIQGSYGSPCGAWAHEQADGWY